jgi:signal transduction histidine kinase
VWAINPRNDHMSTIIQRMESYARPLSQAKDIHFNFRYDPQIPALNLQMDKRKNFYLIFKEAVNNALKYSNCTTLNVDIHLQHHKIELTVNDDGDGFDMSKIQAAITKSLSGNGLKNMQMRAKELKATFAIESEPGKGCNIFLAFSIP